MKGNRGFIKAILLIVIALIVLGFFGYNLESIVKSETVRANLSYGWNLAVTVWEKFLETPARWIWDNIVIELVWNNLQTILGKVR